MNPPLTIWLLGDGKPGHENQSLGLAEALGRRVSCEIHRISLPKKSRLKAALAASAGLPKPSLIIGAGHATHLPLLWLARKNHARSIVLMRPSLPMWLFDVCIVPSHDFEKRPQKPNLIISRGALNRVAPPADAQRDGKLILIGGPSSSHGWDGKHLLGALSEITTEGHWQLTDSRRTPDEFLGQIREKLPQIEIFPHQETTPDWLPSKLATATEVWVTEDSVSMVYEALSSGAKVGLLPVPHLKSNSRILRGLEEMAAGGYLTSFENWKKTGLLPTPPETLREADRCAGQVLQFLNAQ